jgi:protein TonB
MRPPEPISGLVFLPKYRIRFDDGSELVIPSLDGLEQRVRKGEIRPDTVIFDAGRGIWCRAGEAPVVRSIVNEIGPQPLSGWTDESDADAPEVAVATDVPERPESVVYAPPRPGVVEAPRRTAPPARPRFDFDFDAVVTAARTFALATRLRFPVTRRARLAVTSVVGSAGVAALGFVFFQSRDISATDFILRDPGVASADRPASVQESPDVGAAPQAPPTVTTPAPAASRGSTAPRGLTSAAQSQEPARSSTTSNPASTNPASISSTPAPVNRPPAITMRSAPAIPLLSERQVADDIDTSSSTLAVTSIVPLPAPPPLLRAPGTPTSATPVTFTQAPRVLNTSRIQQELERVYPIGLRALGIGGRVELSFYVNEQGVAERYEIRESSLNKDLDEAALEVAEVFQFSPALRGNERVATWFAFGITFGAGANAIAPAGANPSGAAPSLGAASATDQPVATQFEVAPRVSNTAAVRQALEKEYPNALRDAGIVGRVEVWFYVNEDGGVDAFQLKLSSNNTALDQAALRVAQVFEFTPGSRGGEPIPGWVSVGITFNANAPSASD